MKPLNNKYWPKQFNSVDIVLSNLKRDSYGLETEQKNNNSSDSFLNTLFFNKLYKFIIFIFKRLKESMNFIIQVDRELNI